MLNKRIKHLEFKLAIAESKISQILEWLSDLDIDNGDTEHEMLLNGIHSRKNCVCGCRDSNSNN